MRRALYRAFRSTYALEQRIRRRLTRAGGLVVTGLGAAAVVGIDTNRSMAYQAFTFLLSLLAVSIASSAFFRPSLTVRRVLPRFGTAGQPLAYRLLIANRRPVPEAGLILIENLADPLRPDEEGSERTRVAWRPRSGP